MAILWMDSQTKSERCDYDLFFVFFCKILSTVEPMCTTNWEKLEKYKKR